MATDRSFSIARREAAYAFDRERMSAAIVASNGVVAAAARLLGMPSSYFYIRAKAIALDINAVRASIAPSAQSDAAPAAQ